MFQGLLLLSLLLQGIPVQPAQSGTITGVVRSEDGKPVAGVRVAAMPQLDSLQAESGPTLSSLAETDAEGRFTLENVPPGRYYVAAGRLDLPTFYPGTQSLALGRSVQVTPGSVVRNIDFNLSSTSSGRAENPTALGFVFTLSANASALTLLDVPLDVKVAGGGKLPFISGGTFTTIKLTGTSGVTTIPIGAARITFSPPLTDYQIAIDGLPDGYSVKSIKYGTELVDRILRITSIVGPNGTVLFGSSGVNPTTQAPLPRSLPQPLEITLEASGWVNAPSILPRVRGSMDAVARRPVYLSGVPGTVFTDGTFEFRNVPPGRHVLMTRDNSRLNPPLVATVVVTDKDVNEVKLEASPVLPRNAPSLSPAQAAGGHAPGIVVPASMRGRILDGETHVPVTAGTVFLVGDSWATFELGADGKFEFQHLLPGAYELEVQAVGYPTFRREIVVDEQDINVDLNAG